MRSNIFVGCVSNMEQGLVFDKVKPKKILYNNQTSSNLGDQQLLLINTKPCEIHKIKGVTIQMNEMELTFADISSYIKIKTSLKSVVKFEQ